MEQHLSARAPPLGMFSQSNNQLANWMSILGDETTIENLGIPGMHDLLACGFCQNKHWYFLNFSWYSISPLNENDCSMRNSGLVVNKAKLSYSIYVN